MNNDEVDNNMNNELDNNMNNELENENMIPCEFCENLISFENYGEHCLDCMNNIQNRVVYLIITNKIMNKIYLIVLLKTHQLLKIQI